MTDEVHETVIHTLVSEKDIETVKHFLKCGLNVNQLNIVSDSPLHLAAFNQDPDMTEVTIRVTCLTYTVILFLLV